MALCLFYCEYRKCLKPSFFFRSFHHTTQTQKKLKIIFFHFHSQFFPRIWAEQFVLLAQKPAILVQLCFFSSQSKSRAIYQLSTIGFPKQSIKSGSRIKFLPKFSLRYRGGSRIFSKGGGGGADQIFFRSTKLIFRALPKHCFAPTLAKFSAPQPNF